MHVNAIDAFLGVKRNEAVGQFDLFADEAVEVTPPIPAGDWDKRERLAFEREMLGLYVSDHPLHGLEAVLRQETDRTTAALGEDGAVVTLAGILSGVQRRITRQGAPWASAVLEDIDGSVEALFFPRTYEEVGQYVAEDAIVVLKGRVNRREEQPRLMVMDLRLPDLEMPDDPRPVIIELPTEAWVEPLVTRLRDVLAAHPGGHGGAPAPQGAREDDPAPGGAGAGGPHRRAEARAAPPPRPGGHDRLTPKRQPRLRPGASHGRRGAGAAGCHRADPSRGWSNLRLRSHVSRYMFHGRNHETSHPTTRQPSFGPGPASAQGGTHRHHLLFEPVRSPQATVLGRPEAALCCSRSCEDRWPFLSVLSHKTLA